MDKKAIREDLAAHVSASGTMSSEQFLPGVPEDLVRASYSRAPGNEIASGKFANPDSSAALAANGFGWFLDRAGDLPPLPGTQHCGWPAGRVDIERELRLPWTGGRHPWLDAVVETHSHLIGVESKRLEPFRGRKVAKLSEAYDRGVWGERMEGWTAMRDTLRDDPTRFRHLDAAQLVKHALGLATQAAVQCRAPVLFYLFAEPAADRRVSSEAIDRHRAEIARFARALGDNRVSLRWSSWREWLDTFAGEPAGHARRVLARYRP